MVVTLDVFQAEMSPLNADAPSNMAYMSVTLAVLQEERSPLNDDAPRNM